MGDGRGHATGPAVGTTTATVPGPGISVGKRSLVDTLPPQPPPRSGPSASTAQGKPGPEALAWRNAVIEGENRIQEVIRAAQHDRKGRIALDLVIAPDFVGVDQHTASGAAPPGKDPDGLGVHNAAELALRDIADQAPSSRRIMSVVLDRTSGGWERSRFALVGDTKAADDAQSVPVATGQGAMTSALDLAHAAGHGEVSMDVACSSDGVRILSWRSSGTSTARGSAHPSTDRVTKALAELASLAGSRTLVYELRHRLGESGWDQEAMHLVGEVKPPAAEDEPEDAGQTFDPDDAQEIVADVKNKRRLILSTAAELIAEQDPTRLQNLVFSLGPLLLVGMVRVGKIARLGKKWKPRSITDAVCEIGCEGIARQINKHVGGEIIRILPKDTPRLGAFRGQNWRWAHHEVVVRNGRVYDITTGHQGLEIAEYKKLWAHSNDINFGF